MLTIDFDDVRAHVLGTLHYRSEYLWMPGLAQLLSRVVWHHLETHIGLSRSSYGTARLLLRNPAGVRRIVARCSTDANRRLLGGDGDISVEVLPSYIARQVAATKVRFMDVDGIVNTISYQLEEACSVLSLVPTAWPTVCTLVRSLHLIDSNSDETDVSFSDPSIPFSVFISIPKTWSQVAALRVAESLLHEAMHLQLTLVEQVVPLVQPDQGMYYSPWRQDHRDSESILQALYVFAVIRSFLSRIPAWRHSTAVSDYLANRIAQIDRQIAQLQYFRECDELTPTGAALVSQLIDTSD